ncbi:MAG: bifunctional adenosylcobinamide kinase/adenosylcobinamide-phosphate guanylyltransferase [Bryobacteraceae bacterium]
MPSILIGGGSRSGKSRYALEVARTRGPRLAFIATAQAFDDEMRQRIDRHRSERGTEFTTIEEPLTIARAISEAAARFDTILVDCLTLWLSNLMLAGGFDVAAESLQLLEAVRQADPATVILVTNEVGCGIVPDNALAREFRDAAGRLNQQAAEQAAEVYWMVFGIPMRVR